MSTGTSGGVRKPQPASRNVRISKELSYMLRHAPPPGSMDEQGFVSASVLMAHMKSKPTLQELQEVIESNDKKRFVLDDSASSPRIRAAQGHSVQLQAPVLTPVTDASSVPCAVHATSKEGWEAIQASGSLLRMSRSHIHFATQPQLLRANSWASVMLRLKLQEALDAGHAFFLSSNGVLLCEGPLPVCFVEQLQQQQAEQLWPGAGPGGDRAGINPDRCAYSFGTAGASSSDTHSTSCQSFWSTAS
ncbi:hypothetical protein OEZ85_006312 [Tetradesmus obliquus]|uniref:2'-phosphotransferase n=1 Tax=Tetradesmus obliquus TaxID=3088 RepID=A0ABY8TW96_TETOB|nr:hypothetical protein OEZ85_006312 [Tetradesmus obliquus]